MDLKEIENQFKYKEYSIVKWNDYWFYVKNQHLFTLDFLIHFQNKVDWIFIQKHLHLNNNLLFELGKYFNWNYKRIYEQIQLSNRVIEKYKNKINWQLFSKYQNISLNNFLKWKNYIDKDSLSFNENLSYEDKKQLFDLIINDQVEVIKNEFKNYRKAI